MTDTGFSVPAAKLDRLASCYEADPDTGTLQPLRRCGRQSMEPAAGVPGRHRRAGLDNRRLPGLRPDDAEQGKARQ